MQGSLRIGLKRASSPGEEGIWQQGAGEAPAPTMDTTTGRRTDGGLRPLGGALSLLPPARCHCTTVPGAGLKPTGIKVSFLTSCQFL